jgi:hypothetical protein
MDPQQVIQESRCKTKPQPYWGQYPVSSNDAGHRLVWIFEMLELCLLHLANEEILSAQRVSKRFASVITSSSKLQKKLFFTADPAITGADVKTRLNPIFTNKLIQIGIPLFFDNMEKRLTRHYRDGHTRLYCQSMTTTKVLVHMDLSPEKPVSGLSLTTAEIDRRTRILDEGSWRRMYLSQPSCHLSWRIEWTELHELRSKCVYTPHRVPTFCGFLGTIQGESTLGALLDSLAKSSVIEGK